MVVSWYGNLATGHIKFIDLFISPRVPLSVGDDGYVDKNKNKNKNKSKHITKLKITKQKQISRKPIPPPSAVDFTHSGDEAPLVKTINQKQKCD
jgi:hypothetical protein